MSVMDATKVCTSCNITKPINEFRETKLIKSGRFNQCIDCRRKMSREYSIQWRINHPEKFKAEKAISNATSRGRMAKLPCQVCGKEKAQAHHHDYSRKFSVVWLCPKHHKQVHKGDIECPDPSPEPNMKKYKTAAERELSQ